MDEATKTRKLWGPLELSVLVGKGIDIGCGPDPVAQDVRRFDTTDGDANEITRFVHEDFDYVFSSHCLEHMHDPRKALHEWWKLVRPGGHLFFIVPDEDLYEQGVFPSRFNPDHKATFTLSKAQSWSPLSLNVLDLAHSLPGGQIVSLVLQDQGYDRSQLRHGTSKMPLSERILLRIHGLLKSSTGFSFSALESLSAYHSTQDQTIRPDAVAQIQCIIKKLA